MSSSYLAPTLSLLAAQDGVLPLKNMVKIPQSILSQDDVRPNFKRRAGEATIEAIVEQSDISYKSNGQRYFCIVHFDGSCDLFPFQLVDEINIREQRVMLILDCELVPLIETIESTHTNVLVIFDVVTCNNYCVRDKLETLSTILWDGTCKCCHQSEHGLSTTNKKSNNDKVQSCRTRLNKDCDFGVKLSHARFQHVVIKRCLSIDELQRHHLSVFDGLSPLEKEKSLEESRVQYSGEQRPNPKYSHYYDGFILEGNRDTISSGTEDYCYKFKRDDDATLDVFVKSKPIEDGETQENMLYGAFDSETYYYVRRQAYLVDDKGNHQPTEHEVFLPDDLEIPKEGMIVECSLYRCIAYDVRHRPMQWVYRRVRTDKTRPNHVLHEQRVAYQALGMLMTDVFGQIKMRMQRQQHSVAGNKRKNEDPKKGKRLIKKPAIDDLVCWVPVGQHKAIDAMLKQWKDRVSNFGTSVSSQLTSSNPVRNIPHAKDPHATLPNLVTFEHEARKLLVSCFASTHDVVHILPRQLASTIDMNLIKCFPKESIVYLEKDTLLPSSTPSKKAKVVMIHSLLDICQSKESCRKIMQRLYNEYVDVDGYVLMFTSMLPWTRIMNEHSYDPSFLTGIANRFDNQDVAIDEHPSLFRRYDTVKERKNQGCNWAGQCAQTFRGDYGVHILHPKDNPKRGEFILEERHPLDNPFHRVVNEQGFNYKATIPLSQLAPLLPGSVPFAAATTTSRYGFDYMYDDELILLHLRHCLVWKRGIKLSSTINGDTKSQHEGVIQRVHVDFPKDGNTRLGPFAAIGPSTDVIRYVLSFLDIKSHFTLASVSKSLLRMYLIGFETPILAPTFGSSQSSHLPETMKKAITFDSMPKKGLFRYDYTPNKDYHFRFDARALRTNVLSDFAQQAPCLHDCFYCTCQRDVLEAIRVVDVEERREKARLYNYRHVDTSHTTHYCMCLQCTINIGESGIFCDCRDERMGYIKRDMVCKYHNCLGDGVSSSELTYMTSPVISAWMKVFILKSLFIQDANLLPSVVDNNHITMSTTVSSNNGWLAILCPELFSLQQVWKDPMKLQRIHDIRVALDEAYYIPFLCFQYLLPGALYEHHAQWKSIEKGRDEAYRRWEEVSKESMMTWKERWIMLRTTRRFKGHHCGISDRSYGDVTDCSPFVTSYF